MISSLLQAFSAIIDKFTIHRFEIEGNDIALHLEFVFRDESTLYVREYFFGAQRRKYAYHWQNREGQLLVRWDNALHWPNIETTPHHKHVGVNNTVQASFETDLEEVLGAISAIIGSKKQ